MLDQSEFPAAAGRRGAARARPGRQAGARADAAAGSAPRRRGAGSGQITAAHAGTIGYLGGWHLRRPQFATAPAELLGYGADLSFDVPPLWSGLGDGSALPPFWPRMV